MPTAQPPVCLLHSPRVTATSQTTAQTSSPNKDARPPPSSLSWTVCTGRGKLSLSLNSVWYSNRTHLLINYNIMNNSKAFICFFPFRQKVCCGIVYKGRFGEVIIDPRLFKPCCSSKKLASTQVAAHLPDTLPPQLPEDMKETWWLLLLNPPVGLSMASTWICLQWQTSYFLSPN